jgi:hypothetical protein
MRRIRWKDCGGGLAPNAGEEIWHAIPQAWTRGRVFWITPPQLDATHSKCSVAGRFTIVSAQRDGGWSEELPASSQVFAKEARLLCTGRGRCGGRKDGAKGGGYQAVMLWHQAGGYHNPQVPKALQFATVLPVGPWGAGLFHWRSPFLLGGKNACLQWSGNRVREKFPKSIRSRGCVPPPSCGAPPPCLPEGPEPHLGTSGVLDR